MIRCGEYEFIVGAHSVRVVASFGQEVAFPLTWPWRSLRRCADIAVRRMKKHNAQANRDAARIATVEQYLKDRLR